MADFVPVSFTKDGVTQIASSRAEYVAYIFDGWILGDVAPAFPHGVLSTSVRNIEVVSVLPDPNPDNAGTLYLVETP